MSGCFANLKTINKKQFIWRPRPKTLLNDEELEEIRKKLPQLMKRFDKEDALQWKRIKASANAHKVAQLREFRTMMAERHQLFLEQQQKRISLGLVQEDADEGSQDIIEKVEELVSEKVEPV
jgi:translation initiation factor 3 subunit B